MSSKSHPKAPARGDTKATRPKHGKLSFQNRYNKECRYARRLLLRKYPHELQAIVRQVEREGWSPRVKGAFVHVKNNKRKKERAPAYSLLGLATSEGDNTSGH